MGFAMSSTTPNASQDPPGQDKAGFLPICLVSGEVTSNALHRAVLLSTQLLQDWIPYVKGLPGVVLLLIARWAKLSMVVERPCQVADDLLLTCETKLEVIEKVSAVSL